MAVPVHPGQRYEPPDYVARWEDDYRAARKDGAATPGQIAAAMDKAPGGRRAPGKSPGPLGSEEARRPKPQSGSGGGGGKPRRPPRQDGQIEEDEEPGDRLDRLFADQARSATPEQRASVLRWQGKDERFYEQVQRSARGQSATTAAFDVAEDLQDLMVPLPEGIEVWRGVRDVEKTFGVQADRLEELVGQTYDVPAFFATSLDRKVAETEFTRPGPKPAFYRIAARVGTPAVWVPPLGRGEGAYQQELLFPPGVVVRILGVVRSSGVPVVEVEVSDGEVGR